MNVTMQQTLYLDPLLSEGDLELLALLGRTQCGFGAVEVESRELHVLQLHVDLQTVVQRAQYS